MQEVGTHETEPTTKTEQRGKNDGVHARDREVPKFVSEWERGESPIPIGLNGSSVTGEKREINETPVMTGVRGKLQGHAKPSKGKGKSKNGGPNAAKISVEIAREPIGVQSQCNYWRNSTGHEFQ